MKYWVNTVSLDHLQRGISGGFMQSNHGALTNLKRVNKGDFTVFYSPKTQYENGTPLQKFTAIAECIDDHPYQVDMAADFHPWRRNMKYLTCMECAIQPIIPELKFIKDKTKWGFPFRRGLFEIPGEDFYTIASAMKAELSLII